MVEKRRFSLDNGGERDVVQWENLSKRPEYKTFYECYPNGERQ